MGSIFYILVEGGIRQDPLRALAALGAIALGVAFAIAMHLADASSAAAFGGNSTDVGRHADLQIVESGRGVDERVYARIRSLPAVTGAEPVLFGDAVIAGSPTDPTLGVALRIVGLDLVQPIPYAGAQEGVAGPFQARGTTIDPQLALTDGALISAEIARRYALRTGSHFDVLVQGRVARLRVAQVLPRDVVELDSSTVLVDIATAQTMFDRVGFLDRIDCTIAGNLSDASDRIARLLPSGARVQQADAPATGLARLVAALRHNLEVLTLVTLLLSSLLVYDAVGTSVALRGREIAIVRSLGAKRGTVFAEFLVEGIVYGAVGGALGALAAGFIATNAGTIRLDESALFAMALGVLAGILVGTLSAALPAARAMSVRPASALGFGATARVTYRPSRIPSLLALAGDALRRASERRAPFAWLAGLELRATRGRTSIVLAALALGAANALAYAVASASFRDAIAQWAMGAMRGDLVISAARLGNSDTSALPAGVLARVREVAGVATATPVRSFDVVALGKGVLELRGDDADAPRSGPSPAPNGRDTPAFVTPPLARRLAVRVGDVITVATPAGNLRLRVAGTPDDFVHPEGVAIVPFARSARWFGDDRPDAIVVTLRAGATLQDVRSRIVRAIAPLRFEVQTTRELRETALALLDRTFALGNALGIVTLGIALVALSAMLTTLVLERRAQIAMLRYVGASRRFIVHMLLCETAVLAGLACAIGLAAGGGGAMIALVTIGTGVFGRAIPMVVPMREILLILGTTFAAALMAGLPASRLAARIPADGAG